MSYAAAQFVFAPLWGRLSDRIGRRPVLLVTVAGHGDLAARARARAVAAVDLRGARPRRRLRREHQRRVGLHHRRHRRGGAHALDGPARRVVRHRLPARPGDRRRRSRRSATRCRCWSRRGSRRRTGCTPGGRCQEPPRHAIDAEAARRAVASRRCAIRWCAASAPRTACSRSRSRSSRPSSRSS